MWATLGKYALKLAVYALGHPEVVKAVINIVPTPHKEKD